MEAPTHVETSRDGRKCTREVEILIHDARENVGEPTSERNQRKSLDQYTGYMALMSETIDIDPSSFEEEVLQLVRLIPW